MGDEIVYSKTVKILVAVSAILVILMASVFLAASRDTTHASGMDSHRMHGPQAIVLTLTTGTASGMNVSFTVNNIARIGRADATVTSYDKPLQGKFNMSKGFGFISMANRVPSTTRKDYANNSSIPVAGVNIVLALEDINMTGHIHGNMSDHWKGNMTHHWKGNRTGSWKGNRSGNWKNNMTGRCGGNMTCHCKGHFSMEFSKVVVGFPNGTMKTFTLNKPVKVICSKRTKMVVIDADPSFANLLASICKSGQKFPANAAPMSLKSFMAAT